MNIVDKIFKKRGIKDRTELSKEEQSTLSMYERILSKKELTLADLKEFILGRIAQIEGRWSDQNFDNAKKAELIPQHTVYKTILKALDAPQLEREALERSLLSMLEI